MVELMVQLWVVMKADLKVEKMVDRWAEMKAEWKVVYLAQMQDKQQGCQKAVLMVGMKVENLVVEMAEKQALQKE